MPYDLYSALGNETRVKLLLCLAKKSKNVTDMIKICGLAQSAVSQHLTKLKNANLVVAKKNGQEILYSLKNKKIAKICLLIEKLRKETL